MKQQEKLDAIQRRGRNRVFTDKGGDWRENLIDWLMVSDREFKPTVL